VRRGLAGSALAALLACGVMTTHAQDTNDRPQAEDTSKAAAESGSAVPTLTPQQRDRADIAVAHPRAANGAQHWSALGQVLDASAIVADFGQLDAAAASERAADAELQRLQGLYRADAASSLKMVQSAQAEQVRARTQHEVALAACVARWAPIARLPEEQRHQMIQHAASGQHLLVRASLLGRQSIGQLPESAMLQVDGMQVPARVLGITAQGSADLQSAGILLLVSAAPAGLGPGARIPVTLMMAARSGVVVPDAALIYGTHGARVFKQLMGGSGKETWHYVEVPIDLLERQADGWLVRGVSSADLIVVRGAGALWSLEAANLAAGPQEDDDD